MMGPTTELPGAGPPPPPSVPGPPGQMAPRRRRRWWVPVLVAAGLVVLMGSLAMNMYLLFGLRMFIGRPLERTVLRPGRSDQVIALWEVEGMIDGDQASAVAKFCRRVHSDADVKAVVVRVTSGGGMVSSCDQIYRHFRSVKEGGKTLVISMGGMAASGGYYISAPADAIYAEPTTVTGSIGVIAAWPVLKGTLEKYGARMVVVRSTHARAWKAAENFFEEPADYQLAELRKTIDAMQERFEGVVRAQRGGKLKTATSENTYTGADGKEFTIMETEPFNGKVFLADRAKELGLVDKIGYLDDAIDEAQRLAGLSKPKTVRYRERKGLLRGLGWGRTVGSLSSKLLEEMQTPRLMMVWRVPAVGALED